MSSTASAICSTSSRRERSAAQPITFVKDRPGHDRRYAIDATKLESELGWRAHENFETGIERTIRWYLENPERRERYGRAAL